LKHLRILTIAKVSSGEASRCTARSLSA
jgi:hypothetical protein